MLPELFFVDEFDTWVSSNKETKKYKNILQINIAKHSKNCLINNFLGISLLMYKVIFNFILTLFLINSYFKCYLGFIIHKI